MNGMGERCLEGLGRTKHFTYCKWCKKLIIFYCYLKPVCKKASQGKKAVECPKCGEFLGWIEASPGHSVLYFEFSML